MNTNGNGVGSDMQETMTIAMKPGDGSDSRRWVCFGAKTACQFARSVAQRCEINSERIGATRSQWQL